MTPAERFPPKIKECECGHSWTYHDEDGCNYALQVTPFVQYCGCDKFKARAIVEAAHE